MGRRSGHNTCTLRASRHHGPLCTERAAGIYVRVCVGLGHGRMHCSLCVCGGKAVEKLVRDTITSCNDDVMTFYKLQNIYTEHSTD